MRLRQTLIVQLIVVLAIGPALGQSMPLVLEQTAPSQTPAPTRVADLDFNDDFPAPARAPGNRPKRPRGDSTRKSAPPTEVPREENTSRTWVYWALGTLGFGAVAGGAAWYIHSVSEDGPAPPRSDQVFSDGP